MGDLLFGKPNTGARREWHASDFVNVDDTVRGGSSSSSMTVVGSANGDEEKNESYGLQDAGSIEFGGFLDTTKLGGAGFASQAYSNALPGTPIDVQHYSGLRLTGRRIANESLVLSNGTYPGGGKAPVTSFVLNLKTEEAKKRPDGRRESTVVYEWRIDLNTTNVGELFDVHSAWSDFHPTYRGKPAKDAPPLDPSQQQSGSFTLRMIDLSAVLSEDKLIERSIKMQSPSSYVTATKAETSGEYYGFAMFIVATVVMVVWMVWALTPDNVLRSLGVDWYPNREWAFLVPAWSLMCVLFVYAAYIALNIHNNPPLDDVSNVVDSHSNILAVSADVMMGEAQHPLQGRSMAQTGGIDGPMANDVYDIPPGIVSRERHLS